MTPLASILLAAASAAAPEGDEFAQMTIQQRVVIRIPATLSALPPEPRRRVHYKEKKGPKCLAMSGLAGAAVVAADSIELVLRGGQRLRAELADECPAIDFYSGFYLLPTGDGMICAKRDDVRSRAGAQCGIERFRKLVPVK